MTSGEQAIWNLVRQRRCLGYRFVRQRIIGSYIVDFWCAELKLALEIEGGHHEDPEAGVRYLRITNDEATQMTPERLARWLSAFVADPTLSLPAASSPSLGRRGPLSGGGAR